MLTRLEVDGFKNLLGFEVDFGPFNCIAGPNGVGKSNIFDAIRFLSLLSDNTIMDAALQVRGTDPDTANLRELFWTTDKTRTDHFTIAAEMIVEPFVQDDFGRPAEATSTYLRYEVEIGYEPPELRGSLGRLFLQRESLNYITKGETANRLKFPHSAQHFRDHVVLNKRRGSGFISTLEAADGQIEILIHQDGGSSGRPQKAPAASAPRTIVGTSNTSTTPTILAARREMQSWRFLALEPTAMRGSDHFRTSPYITEQGAHLPATLYRLATTNPPEKGGEEGVYARLAARLSDLLPVNNLLVDVDEVRQLLTLAVEERSGCVLPARSLSDGTLRFLTLAVLSEDPDAQGLMCMEEPENGIHPAKMDAMVALLKDIAVDPFDEPGPDNPLRQVILATHSPVLVQLLEPDDLLVASDVLVTGPDGTPARTLRCRPIIDTWRAKHDDEPGVGLSRLLDYLTYPEDATFQKSLQELFQQLS